MFAVAPGNLFYDDGLATAAMNTSQGIKEEDKKAPEGDELKAALGELVVTGCRLMAARADCSRAFAWQYGHEQVVNAASTGRLPLHHAAKSLRIIPRRRLDPKKFRRCYGFGTVLAPLLLEEHNR